MPIQTAHDSSPFASAVDAALVVAKQAARAAALAVEHLEQAERSTKPQHARRWRIAAFGAMQETKVLARRSMEAMADVAPVDESTATPATMLAAVIDELEAMAKVEPTLVGGDALGRAAERVAARFTTATKVGGR